jgi:hypothetical protein
VDGDEEGVGEGDGEESLGVACGEGVGNDSEKAVGEAEDGSHVAASPKRRRRRVVVR